MRVAPFEACIRAREGAIGVWIGGVIQRFARLDASHRHSFVDLSGLGGRQAWRVDSMESVDQSRIPITRRLVGIPAVVIAQNGVNRLGSDVDRFLNDIV